MRTLPRELMTVEEVAELLKVSRAGVYRWVETGRLKALRVGSLLRFTPEDLRAFIEAGR